MIVELGAFALALGLALSIAQAGVLAFARVRRSPGLAGAGEGMALGAFLAIAVAFATLVWAFVVSDFSVANVAENSHTAKPLLYRVAGAWGSHEGSILLWCLALTGFGAAVAGLGRGLPAGLKATALATQGVLGTVFLAYTAFASNPFARLATPPVEGRSLNPLLQDPALAFHPPLLYAGYVGLSIVFSFAVAALIEGRVDAAWARWVRPWTLAAWSLLTLGITLGAFWAYYELGWGGWWFWDPVENASFMPWLVATALLHSAIVTEKRGALPGWTVFLALAAFSFSMLGAFLVRSGVLTSVHAFAVDPERGVLLLIILGVTAGAGFALFAWRAPSLTPGGLFAPVSRESALVLNNILLAAATATVLLGTLYPLIREAMTGEAISVGPPYFNLTFTPLMAVLLLLLPAGPLLAWKRGDALGAAQRLWAAAGLALLVGVAVFAVVSPKKAFGAAGMALGAWLIAGAVAELVERGRAFRVPAAETARRLVRLPRGAWGMTLAHIGLGIFVLGACFETGWKAESAQAVPLGGQVSVGGYHLTLEDVEAVEGPNYDAERGRLVATKGDRLVCRPAPERRLYLPGGQTTSEVAICHEGLSHLYVVLGERREAAGASTWLVRAYWNPLALLIFLGPAVMALGGAISLSDRRLRLGVARKAEAGA
ncbi:heme lyase CcmF/NrfE family subunit [Phenylobacterium sp.]|jgi:cytochrome c-type biogenesis protein CcmF|uniref:heme lyase CcmF/NrfE family subunit n=1 Tax=Phenylobacterium sp. TaxID=1871053 RepID=UPI002E33EE82|nr:heme lyase CcmF/NrfE family subunit [Phenylobacterium sp.]HEX2561865.1 heme lyase CcmF/NrfE family subunit [Phenylobacterium sp.]